MTQWYVQSGEEMTGPLSPAELLQLVRSGDVVGDTPIRKDDSAWFPASDVGGLFEAARRPTVYHFCPYCERRVSAPPTQCPKCDRPLTKTKTKIIENAIAGEKPKTEEEHKGPAMSAKRWLQRRVRRNGDQ